MEKCESTIMKILFIIEEEMTHCHVAVQATGDCPIGVQGWHYKAFVPSISIVDILKENFDYLRWPLKAPMITTSE